MVNTCWPARIRLISMGEEADGAAAAICALSVPLFKRVDCVAAGLAMCGAGCESLICTAAGMCEGILRPAEKAQGGRSQGTDGSSLAKPSQDGKCRGNEW